MSSLIDVHTSNPPPRVIGFIPHSHPTLEIGYFLSGKGVYSLADKVYPIEAGDVFLFNADERHKVTVVEEDEQMRTVAVHFEARAVWEAPDADERGDLLAPFRVRTGVCSHKYEKTMPHYAQVVKLIGEIREAYESDLPFHARIVKSKLIEALVYIARDKHIESDSEPPLSKSVFPLINGAMDDIDARFCEDIAIGEIAKKVGMSANFFTACFKRVAGMPPKRYIGVKRVDKAIRLLRDTDCTMLDIATRCGFNSSASFNKTFLKITGRKPMEYRKAYEKS